MEERRENKKGRIKFYHLHWPRNRHFFDKGPKILVMRKCPFPIFIYTEKEAFVMMAFNVIKTNQINLKYLTGLLNSKLIAFWLRYKGKMQGNNYQIDKEPLLNLPLINPTDKEIVKQIEMLVDKIIYLKQTHGCSADTSDLETQIDQLVYKLYDLTPEEIEVIEKKRGGL
jgi:adenine-specific DNA-methyltransferase